MTALRVGLLASIAWCMLAPPALAVSGSEVQPNLVQESASQNSAVADVQVLDLAGAYAYAAEHNPGIATLRRELERARLAQVSAGARYASELEFDFTYNQQAVDLESTGAAPGQDREDRYFAELQWRFPWWHKAPEKLAAVQTALDVGIAQERIDRYLRQLQLQVYTAYMAVVLQKEKLAIAEQSLRVARLRRDSLAELFRLGNASQLSLATEESNVLSHEVNVAGLEDVLIGKIESFRTLLNLQEQREIAFVDKLVLRPFEPGTVKLADALAAESRELVLNRERYRLEERKQGQKWFPSLSARVSYSPPYQPVGATNGDEVNETTNIGLVLEVPIPNFRHAKATRALAGHDLNEASRKLNQRLRDTEESVARLAKRIGRLDRQLAMQQHLMDEKKVEVEAARRSFEIGKLTNLDLQFIESKVDDAASQYYDTLYQHNAAVSEFFVLHGCQPIEMHCRRPEVQDHSLQSEQRPSP